MTNNCESGKKIKVRLAENGTQAKIKERFVDSMASTRKGRKTQFQWEKVKTRRYMHETVFQYSSGLPKME